jgi:hypothetical protein
MRELYVCSRLAAEDMTKAQGQSTWPRARGHRLKPTQTGSGHTLEPISNESAPRQATFNEVTGEALRVAFND